MLKLSDIARDVYLKFSNLEGSQHIASEFALLKILQLIKENKISSILEVGSGIGTVPFAIHKAFKKKVLYTGIEDNDFCLKSLASNIDINSTKIYNNLNSDILNERYDLVIIDGKLSNFKILKTILSKNAIIVIEGDRSVQQKGVSEIFPKAKFVHLISAKKNRYEGVFNPNHWQGGLKVFYKNPNIKQLVYWIKYKVMSKWNYFKR